MDCITDTPAHSLFYSIGLASTATILYYLCINYTPLTVDDFLADAAWAYCGMEIRATRFKKQLFTLLEPVTSIITPGPVPNKEIRFYKDGEVVKEMGLLEFRKLDDEWDVDYDYGIYKIQNDENMGMSRIFKAHTDIDLDNIKFSNVSLLSAVMKCNGQDKRDLDVTSDIFKSTLIVGNKLFAKEYMKYIFDMDLPESYSIDIIDSNINQHTITEGGIMHMTEDNVEIINPSKVSETVEQKRRPSFLFGWMNETSETKKDN